MPIHFERTRDCLKEFDFQRLFVQELGWSRPARKTPVDLAVKESRFACRHVAELSGAVVLELERHDGTIPDAKTRAAVHKEVAKQHHENLLIFVDHERTQSLWYWAKREEGRTFPRDHLYCKGQPGDLFLGKLSQMVFDLADFDAEGNVSIVDVARRLQSALDIERVTKKFFRDFQDQHLAFLELIRGIRDERQRRWYASVLLNRLMFIYFLQKKPPGFLDVNSAGQGNQNYLRDKLAESKARGKDRYYAEFLQDLFFEGFAKPEEKRSAAARKLLGKIKYLNGGLFLPHQIEQQNPKIAVPDRAFENLFDLFDRYTWHLDDTPGGKDDEINPDVLGYIFEKYINQKAFGAYYTRTEITEYLCERTIHRLILDAVNTPESVRAHPVAGLKVRDYAALGDLLLDLDARLCKQLLHEVLPGLSLLDPACGSGAFLVAAMKTLINIYSAIVGRIKFLHDRNLAAWLADIEKNHPSVGYFIKKRIITDNLFGVDLMEEATEIARLRLFLALVASAQTTDDLEPLPNIDFNILPGNSLIGLLHVDEKNFEKKYQGRLFRKKYKQVLEEKNRLIDTFRHATEYAEDLTAMRDAIAERKAEAYETLDDILLEDFQNLGIKYEQATWDDKKKAEGRPEKRPLKPADIEALHPFHWGFEFDEILNKRGGFDAIITNPPWETLKPYAKEFFAEHSDLVTKLFMRIEDFEKERDKLLKDERIREAWLAYLSQFPHQSSYFRSSSQYRNQISIINGKKAGTDVNLYKLFLEQCHSLLREGGLCGIITPGSVYNDLGAKQLRELLLSNCRVVTLFGLQNERFIFEGVDHRQKFCILSFQKGGRTDSFTAAFRINIAEAVRPEQLESFFHSPSQHLRLSVATIRKLSPDSLSIMEFKCEEDVRIASKLAQYPLLGSDDSTTWSVRFHRELDMTNDSDLFKTTDGRPRLPLCEGKMIHQFNHKFAAPKYWLDERETRRRLLGKDKDNREVLDYQSYRLGFRDVASNTNERTCIMTMLPPNVFCPHTLPTAHVYVPNSEEPDHSHELFFCSCANSFVVDYTLRQRVTNRLTFFLLNQVPFPRVPSSDARFRAIIERAARLICTTPEFDDLAKEVGIKSHKQGVTDPATRAALRAELDGLVAHLYGLTEAEFAHILTTFPLVPDPVKVAAQNAYRDVERGGIR
ncbi:MAG: ATP-binding protein [Planctomycetes bacterium]|nr:ATP-binding protein [Planctomycetota bacterium]